MKYWRRILGNLSGGAIGLTASLGLVSSVEANPGLMAQRSLVGECRATNRPTPIFISASTVSDALRLLAANERVTLAGAASNGFIAISRPIGGHVQTAVLKTCGTVIDPGKPPNPDTCRRVIFPPEGLAIFSEAGAVNAIVGRVEYLQTVELTTNPATTKTAEDRVWVEVAQPVKGWISNSRYEGSSSSNLGLCQSRN